MLSFFMKKYYFEKCLWEKNMSRYKPGTWTLSPWHVYLQRPTTIASGLGVRVWEHLQECIVLRSFNWLDKPHATAPPGAFSSRFSLHCSSANHNITVIYSTICTAIQNGGRRPSWIYSENLNLTTDIYSVSSKRPENICYSTSIQLSRARSGNVHIFNMATVGHFGF